MKPIHWIMLIFLVGSILTGIFIGVKERKLLKECRKHTVAQIVRFTKPRNQSPRAHLKYFVNNVEYIEKIGVDYQHGYLLLDSVKVIYACDDPAVVRIVEKH